MTTYTTFEEILKAADEKGFKLVDAHEGYLNCYRYVWMRDGKQYGGSIQASIPFNYYKAAMEIEPFINHTMQEVLTYLGLD